MYGSRNEGGLRQKGVRKKGFEYENICRQEKSNNGRQWWMLFFFFTGGVSRLLLRVLDY